MSQPPSLIERRMRNANPVPDEHALPAAARPADVALATVRRLIAEGDVARAARVEPIRQPRARYLAAAAAFVAVALLGVVLYLIGAGDTQEPPVTTVTTTTTETPTTTTSSTTTSSTTSTSTTTTTTRTPRPELFPGTEKFAFGSLEPGPVAMEYSVPIPMRIDIPDVSDDFPLGWFVEQPGGRGPAVSLADSMFADGSVADLPPAALLFVMTRADDPVDVVVDELIEELGSVETSTVEVAGRAATQIDTDVLESTVPLMSLGIQSDGQPMFGIIEGNQHRFIALDTPNGTLIIWYDIPGAIWETLSPYYDRIVASVELAGPIG